MKTTENQNPVNKVLVPLTQTEQGKLKGGFSTFSAKTITDPATNVNVNVQSDSTCACAC